MENLNYASAKTILFQRLSVEVTDFVLIGTLIYFFFNRVTSYQSSLLSFSLCVFAPGFLIVDHIHFQYNGYLIGLYLLSIVLLYFVFPCLLFDFFQNHPLLAAFCFSFTMNSKHLFCFQAPIFFVFLLKTFCIGGKLSLQRLSLRFLLLASIVLLSTFSFLFDSFQPSSFRFILLFGTTQFPISYKFSRVFSRSSEACCTLIGRPISGRCTRDSIVSLASWFEKRVEWAGFVEFQ